MSNQQQQRGDSTPDSADTDADVAVDFARGMRINVTYEEQYGSDTHTDTGIITHAPSQNFDDCAFDYVVELVTGDRGTTRSVSLEHDSMRDLIYDAGFDKDWDEYQLVSITVTGVE